MTRANNGQGEPRSNPKPGAKFWLSSHCEATQVMSPTDSDFEDYKVGDWEKCLCGNLLCVATVTAGTPVLEVVGASPSKGRPDPARNEASGATPRKPGRQRRGW